MRSLLALTAALTLAAAPEPAGAQPLPACGEPASSKSVELVKPELALDGVSKTAISYGRDTEAETLNLVFTIAGCALPDPVPDLSVTLKPKPGTEQLPENLVHVKNATVENAMLEVELTVDGARFDPGSYDAYVVLRSPDLLYVRTPVAISRSEGNVGIPLLIGAGAGLLGFFWLALTKLATRNELSVGWLWLIPVALIAALFGAAAVLSTWWDQDVWTVQENGRAAIAAGVAGATTGSMLTLIGVLWKGQAPGT